MDELKQKLQYLIDNDIELEEVTEELERRINDYNFKKFLKSIYDGE